MYQPMQSNLTLKMLWRSLIKQLVLREPFVWDLQGLRNSRIPSSSLPQSTKFLRALLRSCWNYFSKSWSSQSCSFLQGKCTCSFSLSSEFKCVWSPKHAQESKICPFLNLESPKRRGLKSCLVLGLRRLAVKFIPHKQCGRPHWPPVYYSKIRTGEVCIVNLQVNTMYPYLYLLKAPVYTVMSVTHIKQKQGCSQEVNSDYMFYL